jgi:hypothetical protein
MAQAGKKGDEGERKKHGEESVTRRCSLQRIYNLRAIETLSVFVKNRIVLVYYVKTKD